MQSSEKNVILLTGTYILTIILQFIDIITVATTSTKSPRTLIQNLITFTRVILQDAQQVGIDTYLAVRSIKGLLLGSSTQPWKLTFNEFFSLAFLQKDCGYHRHKRTISPRHHDHKEHHFYQVHKIIWRPLVSIFFTSSFLVLNSYVPLDIDLRPSLANNHKCKQTFTWTEAHLTDNLP